MTYLLALLIVALAALYAVSQGKNSFLATLETGELVALIAGVVLVTFYVVSLMGDYRGRTSQAFRHIVTWLAIALAMIIGYSYRQEISLIADRVVSELVPPGQGVTVATGTTGEHAVRIRRRSDGHFNAIGEVNGAAFSMLIDTGASTVVLRPADAKLAGIDTDNLNYTVPVQTANGTAYAAPVKLRAITIGPIEVQGVDALIAKPGTLNQSLLGMSFLTRLRSYEFSGDFLTLRS